MEVAGLPVANLCRFDNGVEFAPVEDWAIVVPEFAFLVFGAGWKSEMSVRLFLRFASAY